MAKQSLGKQLQAWREAHPLIQWRQRQGLTRADLATMTGLSVNSLQNWELGATFPSARSLRTLEAFTKDPQLSQKWEQWWNEKPTP